MSAYTDASDWCQHDSDLMYITTAPLSWEIGRKGSGYVVDIPVGWIFDVSVPLVLRWIFSPHDIRYLKAAAVHDWLLEDRWSRVTAGAEFHEALRADGVGMGRRLAMWLAASVWRWD